YTNLTFGYGVTLLVLRRRGVLPEDPDSPAPYRDDLVGAAVCNSSGFFVSMRAEAAGVGAEVVAGFLWDDSPVIELLQPEYPPSVTDSVAVVAAKPEARK